MKGKHGGVWKKITPEYAHNKDNESIVLRCLRINLGHLPLYIVRLL